MRASKHGGGQHLTLHQLGEALYGELKLARCDQGVHPVGLVGVQVVRALAGEGDATALLVDEHADAVMGVELGHHSRVDGGGGDFAVPSLARLTG